MNESTASDTEGEDQVRRARLRQSLTAGPASRLKTPTKPKVFHTSRGDESASTALAGEKAADYFSVKGLLQEQLLSEFGEHDLFNLSDQEVANVVNEFTARALESEDIPLNEDERNRLAEELTEETIGLGPLAPLMGDPAITDILVNGPHSVYVERFGRIEPTEIRFRNAEHVVRVIERIAANVGRRIDESNPMADLRLADGTRINATLPPATIDGPTLSIRRFGRRRLRRNELIRLGMMSEDMTKFLGAIVAHRFSLLISGGTGAGKSTLLGALAEAIPPQERIVSIEDTAELMLDQKHLVRMETRPPNIEGRGRISARDLVINSLRMRPDRIIVGEVRGAEALDMLQAMNTGHDGSMSTIHANSPRDAISRLETMVLTAGAELPSRAIREQIVSAIHLLVHVRRFEDGVRRVESISEITGMEGLTPLLQEIFHFRRQGFQGKRLKGEFSATGTVPRVAQELRQRGIDLSLGLFQKKGGDGYA